MINLIKAHFSPGQCFLMGGDCRKREAMHVHLFFSALHSSGVRQHAPALSEWRRVPPPPAVPVSGGFHRPTVRESPMPGWLLRQAAVQPTVSPLPTRCADSPAGHPISPLHPAGHPGPNVSLRETLGPQRHSPRGTHPVGGHKRRGWKEMLSWYKRNSKRTFFLGNHKVFYSILLHVN